MMSLSYQRKIQNNISNEPVNMPSDKETIISVCIPSYNVEMYLDSCLKTLLENPLAQKTELLVIDDGSVDYTAKIADNYEMNYPQIVKVIHKENAGHGSAINKALEVATGSYFMVVDGDDWVDGAEFGRLIYDISIGKIESDLISSNYLEVNTETKQTIERKQIIEPLYFKKMNFDDLDTDYMYFTLASSLFKTNILRKIGVPFQENTFYVDMEYILFPIPYINSVTFVDYSIYRYRVGNIGQSVHLPNMVRHYDHHMRVMKSVILYRQKTKMTAPQLKYYDAVLKRLLYTHYSLFMIHSENKKKSYLQGKEFDDFLCVNCPELASWSAKKLPLVRVARKKHFQYDVIQSLLFTHFTNTVISCKSKIKKAILSIYGIILKVIYNNPTDSIEHTAFFEQGIVRMLKIKLYQYMQSRIRSKKS